MAFNGSGTFVRNNGTFTGSTVWASDSGAGVGIVTNRHDTHDQDLATGLSNCICKDGQTTVTANIPMSTFKFTGLGNGSSRTDSAALGQLQDQATTWGGTSGGSANAQTISLTPAITAYVSGMTIRFKAGFTNTGSVTLNVNSVGAVTITKLDGRTLSTGEIVASQLIQVVYDGTNFVLVNKANVSKIGDYIVTGVNGSIAATNATLGAVAGANDINIPHSMYVSFITIAINNALVGGSITATLFKNGSTTSKSLTLSSGSYAISTFAPELYTNQVISMQYSSSSFSPSSTLIIGVWGG